LCQFCDKEESVDHLFFQCSLAQFLWEVIREGMNWTASPYSVQDFNDNLFLERGVIEIVFLFFLFDVVCWSIWLNRNDWVFNQKLISSPRAIVFRFLSFLQLWMITFTGARRDALEQLAKVIEERLPEEMAMTAVG
jgi:hypothetical protein